VFLVLVKVCIVIVDDVQNEEMSLITVSELSSGQPGNSPYGCITKHPLRLAVPSAPLGLFYFQKRMCILIVSIIASGGREKHILAVSPCTRVYNSHAPFTRLQTP